MTVGIRHNAWFQESLHQVQEDWLENCKYLNKKAEIGMTPSMKKSLGSLTLTITLCVALLSQASQCRANEEIKTYKNSNQVTYGSDPSEIVSRLEFRNEYVDLPEDGYLNSSIFRGDYAPSEFWLVRAEIPLAAGKSHEFGSGFGLGDITLGARGKIELAEQFSLVLGTDFILNTANEDVLGTGKNQFVPYLVGVWKPDDKWILGLHYWYYDSFSGDSHREDISESMIRPMALYNFPHGYWVLLDPKIYINHEHENETVLYLEGEFGKVIKKNYELWLRGGGHVTGDGREERLGWKAEAGIRYIWD